MIIASGFNETTGVLDMKSAQEVLEGAKDADALKIATEDMITAGEYSIKHSKPGDIILHIGPGAITNYQDLKDKMMKGIEEGCKKYSLKQFTIILKEIIRKITENIIYFFFFFSIKNFQEYLTKKNQSIHNLHREKGFFCPLICNYHNNVVKGC